MTPENAVSFSLIFGLIGAGGVLYTIISKIKKNTQEESQIRNSYAEGILKANMKLDQVCSSLNEMRVDTKAIDNQLKEMSKKQVEHDIRMDNLEDRLCRLEDTND